MATIPTQVAVPSELPQDLKFNAGKIDEFVTADDKFYIDRFGNKHRTIAGMNYDANQAMLNYGYVTKKSFELGNTINAVNEVLLWENDGEYYRWDGPLPKVVPANSTPESTGGIGSGKWLSVGDATLRADLAKPDGSKLVSFNSSTVYAELVRLNGYVDRMVNVSEYGAVGDGITDDTAAIQSAISAATSTGKALYIPNGRYIWNGGTIVNENLIIIGQSRPFASDSCDRLISGTIIVGTFRIASKHVQIYNLGVDRGIYSFPSSGNDALVISCQTKDGSFAQIDNCIALGRASSDEYHSILVEGYSLSNINNTIGILNQYGFAQKSSYMNVSNVTSISCKIGVIVKSDVDFGVGDRCNISNVVNKGNGFCDIGLWLFSYDQQLQNVNVDGLTSSGSKYDVVVQSNVAINEINISNVNASGASIASLYVLANASSKIYSININNFTTGGVTGRIAEIQAANHINISNMIGSITSASPNVNDAVVIGPYVLDSNISNTSLTINYDVSTYAGLMYGNYFGYNKLSTCKAKVLGSGAPKPGYAEQPAGGTGGNISPRFNEAGTSYTRISLPSGNAEINTFNLNAIDGSVIPAGYSFWVQNATGGAALTITPSGSGHIVTTGNTPKVLNGGDKLGFIFDGSAWIQM